MLGAKMDTKTIYVDDNEEIYAVNLTKSDTMDAKSLKDGKTYKVTKEKLEKYKVFTSKKEVMEAYPEYFV